MSNPISPEQGRKLALLSQKLHHTTHFGHGKQAVYNAVCHLGYVQIDSISVVQRAHHHSLYNRVNNYQNHYIAQLLDEKQLFEYWSHAAAFLPMADYRFSLVRKKAIANGDKHWFDKDPKLTRQILDRIKAEGPLQAKNFDPPSKCQGKAQAGWWDWKPAKKALEQLYIEGELMVVKRQGFQKVYDLTERVLPEGIDTTMPSIEEYTQYLINGYLRANGLAKPEHIAYLLKGMKGPVKQQCQAMCEDHKLIELHIGQHLYYALPEVENLLSQRLSRNKVKILSPFDNLLIQRKRTFELFDFDYQIECYVPAPKRQYGYFSLPLLWGQQFAGRADMKVDRKTQTLHLKHLHLETNKADSFIDALKSALKSYMNFNQAGYLQCHTISHSNEHLTTNQIQAYHRQLCSL